MVSIRRTVLSDWPVLRDIRLEALRTAPAAFGSSYAAEAGRDESFWHRRSAGGMFLAYPTEPAGLTGAPAGLAEPVGLAGGYQLDPVTIELVSMYVRPRARGQGVGEALVAAVSSWAAACQATSVHLWVTETNAPARRLYQRCGFTLTGEQQALPSDPGLRELAMRRPLPPAATRRSGSQDQQQVTRTRPAPRAAAPAAGW